MPLWPMWCSALRGRTGTSLSRDLCGGRCFQMVPPMTRSLRSCGLGVLVGVLLSGSLPGEEKQILRYLNEVLLEKEFGGGDGRILRWIESPEVALVEGSGEHRKVLNRVVGQLNEALEGTSIRLRPVEKSRRARRIEVFMVPQSRFVAIGRERAFEPPRHQDGYVWVIWNTEKKFIQRAIVLVAVDRIEGDLVQHVLLEEMTQALGPLGDTVVTPESVMYAKGQDHGKALKLSDWDRRMLGLLYGHLKPGDGGIEVGVAYARFWGK